MLKNLILLFLLVISFLGHASNEIGKPKGIFHQDSAKIGEVIRYSLTYTHPKKLEVVFPDSTFNFFPFEFVKKEFYPTKSDTISSYDSAVYYLRTFEITPVHHLALPAIIFSHGDTVFVYSQADSVNLIEFVQTVSEPLLLKENKNLEIIPEQINYINISIILLAAIATLSLIWLVFGKTLKTKYKLYILKKDHTQFVSRFITLVERFKRSDSLPNLEKAVILWKTYLTNLEEKEIISFTTKEISAFYNDNETIDAALKLCDRAIYGGILSDKASETTLAIDHLKEFAIERYNHFRDLIKNVPNT